MDMNCGGDIWRPYGFAPDHPTSPGHVYTSTPIEFDEENLILTTASGRKYKICSFEGDNQKWISQIKLDIKNGGSEIL